KPTVTDVANDVQLGAVDAGFVWDVTVRQMPKLRRVDLPQFKGAVAQVEIAVLKCSEQPTEALRFARFLGARDRGLREFARTRYETVEGDAWAETPEVVVYSGAMLHPAIEDTLRAFEEREGVKIITVYNGCGILEGQIKLGERPDAFFACDTTFMDR